MVIGRSIFGLILLATATACSDSDYGTARERPEDRAYNECFRTALGPDWAQEPNSKIPSEVYSRAIRACDHLDPFYTTGMTPKERARAPRDKDGNTKPEAMRPR
jgi:hypothetical protein